MKSSAVSFDDVFNQYGEFASTIDEVIEDIVSRNVTVDYLQRYFTPSRYEYDPGAIQRTLSDPVWELLDRGGKRWRPVLFWSFLDAFGEQPADYLPYAALVEILHTGTLIVDDIEDDSDYRRGGEAIHRAFGEDVAIHAGNACFFIPLQIISKNPAGVSPTVRCSMFEMLMEELNRIHLGQSMDIDWQRSGTAVSEAQYLEMAACKTGGLARVAARLAAILTGQSRAEERLAANYAEAQAVAFQITDDLLDIRHAMESAGRFGKPMGNDIEEGKMTLITIHALDQADAEDRARLAEILAADACGETSVRDAIDIFETYGSLSYARKQTESISAEAMTHLDEMSVDVDSSHALSRLTELVVQRQV